MRHDMLRQTTKKPATTNYNHILSYYTLIETICLAVTCFFKESITYNTSLTAGPPKART